MTSVHTYFRKSDEPATFRLTYDVAGAAKRYTDTAELYWQFIGDHSGRSRHPTSRSPSSRRRRSPKTQVQAWAHGPLTGTVAIADDGVVTLTCPRVPADTFVEARVLYPASALSAAPVIEQPRKQTVLDEEAKWANEANARPLKARIWVAFVGSGPRALSLAALGFAILAFLKHGRSSSRRSPDSTSERTRARASIRRSSVRSGASARSRTPTSPRR